MANYLYTGNVGTSFGVNAEQKYLQHLTNIIQVNDIYKLVEADTEYIDLFANHKIEEVQGWGCRLLFTQPKKGIDHKIDLSVHGDNSPFERTVDIAYVDIPCRIDKTYYDNFHGNYWVDAIGSNEGVSKIETQLKDNISTEITHDVNVEVENAFRSLANYRKDNDSYNKAREVMEKLVEPKGNYFEIEPWEVNDMDFIINFFFTISARFKKRNTIFQKGYIWDTTKNREDENNWEQVETNTPTYKRMGVVIDDYLVNKIAISKLSQSFHTKYIDFENRFAYVKETTLGNAIKAEDGKENEDLAMLAWMGDVRVPVLKIREPKKGLEYKYEPENGLHWFFLKSRVYIGLATCLNYIGLFLNKKGAKTKP